MTTIHSRARNSRDLTRGETTHAPSRPERRKAIQTFASLAAAALFFPCIRAKSSTDSILTRAIASSGELLPVIGLGSWITFNVGNDEPARKRCADVVETFLQCGGRLIDCSPMYGSSQSTIGFSLRKLGFPKAVFAADKVWTSSRSEGVSQVAETEARWGLSKLDLLQVHNLDNWEDHLPLLFAMKEAKQLRYVGVTTSDGRRTNEIEQLIRTQPLDFIQVTYNMIDRELDQKLLPLARDRGIAVIINRPFKEGALINKFQRFALPDWVREFDCVSWPQFLLKFIVSHPAVTCAIPATSNPVHVRENMLAAYGRLPDERTRRRMISYVETL